LNVCSETGRLFIHSKEVEEFAVKMRLREEVVASHIIHINIIMDKKEIRDPNEEITFHIVKESG